MQSPEGNKTQLAGEVKALIESFMGDDEPSRIIDLPSLDQHSISPFDSASTIFLSRSRREMGMVVHSHHLAQHLAEIRILDFKGDNLPTILVHIYSYESETEEGQEQRINQFLDKLAEVQEGHGAEASVPDLLAAKGLLARIHPEIIF